MTHNLRINDVSNFLLLLLLLFYVLVCFFETVFLCIALAVLEQFLLRGISTGLVDVEGSIVSYPFIVCVCVCVCVCVPVDLGV
jgi:hypothetical protein